MGDHDDKLRHESDRLKCKAANLRGRAKSAMAAQEQTVADAIDAVLAELDTLRSRLAKVERERDAAQNRFEAMAEASNEHGIKWMEAVERAESAEADADIAWRKVELFEKESSERGMRVQELEAEIQRLVRERSASAGLCADCGQTPRSCRDAGLCKHGEPA